jgi:hypothetical protein
MGRQWDIVYQQHGLYVGVPEIGGRPPQKKNMSNIADEPLVGMGYSILRQAHLKLFFGLKLGI